MTSPPGEPHPTQSPPTHQNARIGPATAWRWPLLAAVGYAGGTAALLWSHHQISGLIAAQSTLCLPRDAIMARLPGYLLPLSLTGLTLQGLAVLAGVLGVVRPGAGQPRQARTSALAMVIGVAVTALAATIPVNALFAAPLLASLLTATASVVLAWWLARPGTDPQKRLALALLTLALAMSALDAWLTDPVSKAFALTLAAAIGAAFLIRSRAASDATSDRHALRTSVILITGILLVVWGGFALSVPTDRADLRTSHDLCHGGFG